MAWIKIIDESNAEGLLAKTYTEAKKGAGRIYNILSVQCHSPVALQSMLGLYQTIMRSDSPLTRAQREMIAVVVSKTNGCLY